MVNSATFGNANESSLTSLIGIYVYYLEYISSTIAVC